jgi:hypothetical protein
MKKNPKHFHLNQCNKNSQKLPFFQQLHHSIFGIRYSIFLLLFLLPFSLLGHQEIEPNPDLNTSVALLANTPNPFAGSTMLRYKLSEDAKIGIKIFDYAGRIVKNINQGSREAGQHSVALLAEDLSSGIYVCAIQIDGATMDTQKITVIK